MQSALDAPTARGVAERLLEGALRIQTSSCDPKGCLAVISAVACSPGAESMRSEVIARRQRAEAVLTGRFDRAKQEGDLPQAIEPAALARMLIAVMQGLAVQAGAGASVQELETIVDTCLQMWPGR